MKQRCALIALLSASVHGLSVDQRAWSVASGASSEKTMQARESNVEALVAAEETALATQQRALEAVAASQMAMAKDQKELQIKAEKVFEIVKSKFGTKAAEDLRARENAALIQTSAKSEQSMYSKASTAAMEKLRNMSQKISKDARWKEQLISAIIYTALVVLFAVYHESRMTYPYPPLAIEPNITRMGFSFGMFEGWRCDPDFRVFCMSCFCMPIRWAKTASNPKIDFMRFWSGMLLMTFMIGFMGVTLGITAFVIVALGVFQRQKIREMYGLQPGTFRSYLQDFAMWTLCIPCAVMQEALEVEFVDPLHKPQQQAMGAMQEDKFLQGFSNFSGIAQGQGQGQGVFPPNGAGTFAFGGQEQATPRKQHGVCC